jgi:hypothetical protein
LTKISSASLAILLNAVRSNPPFSASISLR